MTTAIQILTDNASLAATVYYFGALLAAHFTTSAVLSGTTRKA